MIEPEIQTWLMMVVFDDDVAYFLDHIGMPTDPKNALYVGAESCALCESRRRASLYSQALPGRCRRGIAAPIDDSGTWGAQ